MNLNFFKSSILATCIILTSAACSSVTPSGFIAASRLDPLTSDPLDISVAVGVPKTFQLNDGDAEFHISYVTASEAVSETVPLRVRRSSGEMSQTGGSDQIVYLASFSPADAARISTAQARVTALKEAGQDGNGTISIAVTGGCTTGATLQSIPVSTWLRTDPTRNFVQLTREQDLLQSMDPAQASALQDRLREC